MMMMIVYMCMDDRPLMEMLANFKQWKTEFSQLVILWKTEFSQLLIF